jgi:serine/threonine protein kinase
MKKALSPNALFAGKYRVRKKLGTGSFAHVLLARHEVMERDVALKVLKPEILERMPEVSERFLNEARIVSQLRHPNSVTVYDFGEYQGVSYMVMEYVEGRGLDQLLARGPLSVDQTTAILKQILKSLDEAHAAGVIHRDLKPSNVMLTELHGEPEFVKVLDFGVAKLMGEPEPGQTSQPVTPARRSTQFIGTPIYMSPEQVLGQEVVPASDLYSLGLITYEMLTGDPPLDETNVASVAQRHLEEKALPFKRIKQLPKPFQHLILKATARYPQQRYTSVSEFARDIPGASALDNSAEFSALLAQKAARQSQPTPMPDVFSGKNYVEHPEESGEFWADMGSRKVADPAVTRMPRADDSRERPRPKPRASVRQAELQVDYGKVRRDELRREREVRRTPEESRNELPDLTEWMQYAGAIVVGLIGLHMLGSWIAGALVAKLALGASPLFAAWLWIMFSPYRRVHGGFRHRILLPLSRAWMAVVGVAFLVGALVFPKYAAGATRLQSRWLVGEDGVSAAVLGGTVDALSRLLTRIFEFTAGVVPW